MSGARFGVSYFGVRDPRHARADLDEIAAAGFSAVTHTFSEHDLRYHVEDIGRLVKESKERGLETALDPWGVGGLFGGEAYSELATTDLSCRQIDAKGRSVPACCPNAAATRELLRRWTRVALELGADVLFWDEPHFYLGAFHEGVSPACCRCEACESAWRTSHSDEPLPPEGDERLGAFRAASLRGLLADSISRAGPVRHSVCMLPRGEFDHAASDDWTELGRIPGISRLATDPYWMDRAVDPADFVRRHAIPLREVCDATGHEMEIWVQGIRIAAGDEHHLVEATGAAVEAGAERIAFWSFRGTDRMSWLSCQDPRAAWAAMKDAVRMFR